jgi:hypothetical protein
MSEQAETIRFDVVQSGEWHVVRDVETGELNWDLAFRDARFARMSARDLNEDYASGELAY